MNNNTEQNTSYTENTPYTVNNIPVTGHRQPPAAGSSPADTGKDKATISMILGIVSIVLGILSLFVGFLAVAALGCGIAAIILSKKSRQAALLAGVQRRNEEKAGFITGIIGMVNSVIILLVKLLVTGAVMLFLGYLAQNAQVN